MKASVDKTYKFLGLKFQGDLGPFTCYINKKGNVVWYVQAPPKEPPSDEQVLRRIRFSAIADQWNFSDDADRKRWNDIAAFAHLRISGFNLFFYWCMTGDTASIVTLCSQTGFSLSFPPGF